MGPKRRGQPEITISKCIVLGLRKYFPKGSARGAFSVSHPGCHILSLGLRGVELGFPMAQTMTSGPQASNIKQPRSLGGAGTRGAAPAPSGAARCPPLCTGCWGAGMLTGSREADKTLCRGCVYAKSPRFTRHSSEPAHKETGWNIF